MAWGLESTLFGFLDVVSRADSDPEKSMQLQLLFVADEATAIVVDSRRMRAGSAYDGGCAGRFY